MKGQVVSIIAGFYDVLAEEKVFRVRGAGKLRNANNPPVVGDFVEFTPNGMLEKVYERDNILIRPKIANISYAVVVNSLKEPALSEILLWRMIATLEFQRVKPILVFSKSDLANDIYSDDFKALGYKCFTLRNKKDQQFSALNDFLQENSDKMIVFMGQTGAGKTSLINLLTKQSRLTQEISKALGRGKHTTRTVEAIAYGKSAIVDTPGFSSLILPLTKEELSIAFFAYHDLSTKCKFSSCLHANVPTESCAVLQSIKTPSDTKRYQFYLKLLEETKNDKW